MTDLDALRAKYSDITEVFTEYEADTLARECSQRTLLHALTVLREGRAQFDAMLTDLARLARVEAAAVALEATIDDYGYGSPDMSRVTIGTRDAQSCHLALTALFATLTTPTEGAAA